jgi:hypothetical protein
MVVINLAYYGIILSAVFLVVAVLVQDRTTKTTMMSLAGTVGGLSLVTVVFLMLKL